MRWPRLRLTVTQSRVLALNYGHGEILDSREVVARINRLLSEHF